MCIGFKVLAISLIYVDFGSKSTKRYKELNDGKDVLNLNGSYTITLRITTYVQIIPNHITS